MIKYKREEDKPLNQEVIMQDEVIIVEKIKSVFKSITNKLDLTIQKLEAQRALHKIQEKKHASK